MGTGVAGTILPAYGDDGNQYHYQCEEDDVCAIHMNIYGLVRVKGIELYNFSNSLIESLALPLPLLDQPVFNPFSILALAFFPAFLLPQVLV